MIRPILVALWLINSIPSVWSHPLTDLAIVTDYADIQRRSGPAPSPNQFGAPQNTCPVPEPRLFIERANAEFTIDIGVIRTTLSGYFNIVVNPLARTVRTNGVEFFGTNVRIAPAYTVDIRVVDNPDTSAPRIPGQYHLQIDVTSESSTTPNAARSALGTDYRWGGARPGVVMRVTPEVYRGRVHDSYRVEWVQLLRSAAAVFLIRNARRGGNGCG